MKNKNLKKIMVTILTMILLFVCISGCTPEWVNKVNSITDVIWECEDPVIKCLILKNFNEQESSTNQAYIEIDGVKKDAVWGCGNAHFKLSLQTDKYGQIGESGLFSGHYNLVNDEQLHCKVVFDELFDGKYIGKTIIFKAKKIDGTKYDVKYRSEITWKATDDLDFSFDIPGLTKERGLGHIKQGNSNTDIVFYWLENNKFETYKIKEGFLKETFYDGSNFNIIKDEDIRGDLVLSGTYESNYLNATLNIKEDYILDNKFETINMAAEKFDNNKII